MVDFNPAHLAGTLIKAGHDIAAGRNPFDPNIGASTVPTPAEIGRGTSAIGDVTGPVGSLAANFATGKNIFAPQLGSNALSRNPFNMKKFSQGSANASATQDQAVSDAANATADTTAAPTGISAAQDALHQQLAQLNPLAMQAFYQNVLQPWMTQLSGMTEKANKQYAKAEKQFAGLPGMANYKPGLAQLAQVPQANLGATNLTNAFLGAAAAAPTQQVQANAMQQIQGLLQQLTAQESRLSAYYDPQFQLLSGQALGGGLGGGLTGATPGLGGQTIGLPAPPTSGTP